MWVTSNFKQMPVPSATWATVTPCSLRAPCVSQAPSSSAGTSGWLHAHFLGPPPLPQLSFLTSFLGLPTWAAVHSPEKTAGSAGCRGRGLEPAGFPGCSTIRVCSPRDPLLFLATTIPVFATDPNDLLRATLILSRWPCCPPPETISSELSPLPWSHALPCLWLLSHLFTEP